jgi:hypothetical protein
MKDGKTQLDVKETNISGTTAGNDTTTFASSGLETYYKPIETYEGFHRYDPEFAWEPEEERRLVRKVRFCSSTSSAGLHLTGNRSITRSVPGCALRFLLCS